MSTTQNVLLKKMLVLSALSLVDKIDGRKKLQKIIYLVNSLGWNVFNDFRFYLYGPYSDLLFYELQNLKEAKLMNESESNRSYSYTITEKGNSLLNILKGKINESLESKTIALVKKLNSFSSEDLEIMASLYYLSIELNIIDNNQLIDQLHYRKPHIEKEKIQEALVIFDIIRNVA